MASEWSKQIVQLHASKGKGKGKNKAERFRAWWDMSHSEKWWLEELWSGRLHMQLSEAKKNHGGRVQAASITIHQFLWKVLQNI